MQNFYIKAAPIAINYRHDLNQNKAYEGDFQ